MKEFMGTLLESKLTSYIFIAIATLGALFSITLWFVKHTKNMRKTKLRIALCVVVCSVLVGFWSYFIVYKSVYPLSLAYYEHSNDLTYEVVGVIDNVEQKGKDYIKVTVYNTTYTMAYSSQNRGYYPDNGIAKGKTAVLKIGERSNYILDACKVSGQ